jgi:hypothetical protein
MRCYTSVTARLQMAVLAAIARALITLINVFFTLTSYKFGVVRVVGLYKSIVGIGVLVIDGMEFDTICF